MSDRIRVKWLKKLKTNPGSMMGGRVLVSWLENGTHGKVWIWKYFSETLSLHVWGAYYYPYPMHFTWKWAHIFSSDFLSEVLLATVSRKKYSNSKLWKMDYMMKEVLASWKIAIHKILTIFEIEKFLVIIITVVLFCEEFYKWN